MKELIICAIEREIANSVKSNKAAPRRVKLPLIHLKGGCKLDLSNFDFDDLLA